MVIEIIAVVLILIVLGILGLFLWKFLKTKNNEVDEKLRILVDRYNDGTKYTFDYDKQQEQNIKNLEENMNRMFNNYAKVKNDMLDMSGDYMSKHVASKEIKTQRLVAGSNLGVGDYILSEKAPKDIMARADGQNWLFLYRRGANSGGVSVNKLNAQEGSFVSASVKDDLVVNGKAESKGPFILGESWIMQKSAKGDLRTAPKGANESWDWGKQFVMDKQGYFKAEGGGLVVRGGRSEHNPRELPTLFPSQTDDKNYIRGDSHIDGVVSTSGTFRVNRENPGSMLETQPSTNPNDRYGFGQYANGKTRVYASGFNGESSVNLSIARGPKTFDDVVVVKNDQTIEMKGNTGFAKDVSFEGKVCFAKTCIRETPEGQLQACNKNLQQCRNI